jgi:multicomponent K+:H+ antiporter subunit E
MTARLLPHPLLSFVLAAGWIALAGSFEPGTLIMAAALGLIVPLVTDRYWNEVPRIRRPWLFVSYGAVVLWDILVSNVQVAGLVLFRRGDSLRSRFVTVPLDIRTAEAIATLSATITLTPGTLTADLSADGKALLVHCLETDDAEATVAQIKARYERRLKEIFEP